MQRLLSKLPSLSVNATSKHPTATDSVHINTTLFEETPSPSDHAERFSSNSNSSSDAPLLTDVLIKHSSAFNSQRESGMSKLEQLQFVEMLKGMILGILNNLRHDEMLTESFRPIIHFDRSRDRLPRHHGAQIESLSCFTY